MWPVEFAAEGRRLEAEAASRAATGKGAALQGAHAALLLQPSDEPTLDVAVHGPSSGAGGLMAEARAS